jgi:putative hydrolase of HD superfamily
LVLQWRFTLFIGSTKADQSGQLRYIRECENIMSKNSVNLKIKRPPQKIKSKSQSKAISSQEQNLQSFLELYAEINQLKELKRRGWVKEFPDTSCESIADHTLAVAALSWFIADLFFPELDLSRVIQLAIIHDMGEIYTGDIIPHDNVPAEEKKRREHDAIVKIFSKISGGEKYIHLWEELKEGAKPEAKFVKQIDRLELALQACIYEHRYSKSLQDFFNYIDQRISDPLLRDLLQRVEDKRKKQ